MGFEPFILPKRTDASTQKQPEGSRESKVEALAKLLHSRGLTSSMTDARRLAEGMVDVEKKVVKESTKAYSEGTAPAPTKADVPDTAPHAAGKQTFNLTLSDSFAHFVAQAAALSHRDVHQSVSITEQPQKAAMTYGRDERKPIAEVPHFNAHKQVFFEDAPPISQARGFSETATRQAARPAERSLERPTERPASASSAMSVQVDFSAQRDAAIERLAATKVEATPEAVKMTRTEVTPTAEVVVEQMVVQEPEAQADPVPMSAPQPTPESPALPMPSPIEPVSAQSEPEEQLVEKTQELPVTHSTGPREDLAKKHGVDLFEMFKKK